MRRPPLSYRIVVALAIGAAAIHACTPGLQDYPAYVGGSFGVGGLGVGGDDVLFDAGQTGPPPADAGGLCGNDFHQTTGSPPNVYFVLDASGSMTYPALGTTRYRVLQKASSEIVMQLQLLIKAGAAVFPGSGDQCAAGGEIYPPTYGDPYGFSTATYQVTPNGGTPTSATLKALLPKLTALPGKTLVVLATDGGPNCNENANCPSADCMENIEGCPTEPACCNPGVNCCAAGGLAGPLNCVDRQASVEAVAALAAAGIKVAVVGIATDPAYESVLSDMALAGGAAIQAWPFYYQVDDLATLKSILSSVAGSAIPCTFQVTTTPEQAGLTNVYFDTQIVLSDPVNGWSWATPDTVQLNGDACTKLHSGTVGHVQIVSGCPTEVAK